MKIVKTTGLIAAPFTGMDGQGNINLKNVARYTTRLKNDGLVGVFVAGSTGEGMFLDDSERKDVISEWVKQKGPGFKVIAHTGSTSISSACKLAEHSASIGADAVAIMVPPLFAPGHVDELIGFCARVADAAGNLPFYYYHIPSVSGVNISMVEFIKKAPAEIPNFVGIKFTANNLMEMLHCMQLDNGKWDILHGYDELLLAGLSFGAIGAVGSTYNYMAPLYYGIIKDFREGKMKEARLKQLKSIEIINILIKYQGAIVAGKAVMNLIGLDCGQCRLPLPELKEKEQASLEKELKLAGFFEIINI